MAKQEQFEEVLGRIDTATNKVAADLQAIKDQLANVGLPSDVEDSILSRLGDAAAKLESIGKTETPAGTDEPTGETPTPTEEPVP